MRRLQLASAALLAVVLLAPPVAAAQTDASSDPATRGPLTSGAEACERSTERRDGVLVAEIEVCSTFFGFRPSREVDKARDFGVVWVQSSVDAAPGWCATKTDTTASLDRGRIHSAWPNRVLSPDEPKRVRARIVADAQGSARNTGVVRQSFVLYPQTLRTFFFDSTHGGERGTSAVWSGSSRKKLFSVTAAEVSWRNGTDSPSITPGVVFEIAEKENC